MTSSRTPRTPWEKALVQKREVGGGVAFFASSGGGGALAGGGGASSLSGLCSGPELSGSEDGFGWAQRVACDGAATTLLPQLGLAVRLGCCCGQSDRHAACSFISSTLRRTVVAASPTALPSTSDMLGR